MVADQDQIVFVPYKSKTDDELKQLVRDSFAGLIVWSNCIPPEMLYLTFLPLVFLKAEQIDNFETNNIVLFYEYMSKAGSVGVNGLPMFVSMHTMDAADFERFKILYEKYKTIQEQF